MNDAVEEVKASPDTVGASGEVRNSFFLHVEVRLFVGTL